MRDAYWIHSSLLGLITLLIVGEDKKA